MTNAELFELLMRNEYEYYERQHSLQMEQLERSLKWLGFCMMIGLLVVAGLELYNIS